MPRLRKINQKDYLFYVVTTDLKILTGWEYIEDAKDDKKENVPYYPGLKIFTKRFLKSKAGNLDPDVNSNWSGGGIKTNA